MTPDLTTELAHALGADLRALRHKAGLTLRAAVEHIHHTTGMAINISSLCRWEHAGQPLALHQLIDLCHAYGVYAPYLIDNALRRIHPDHWNVSIEHHLSGGKS